jgi:hypothetical protein
MTTGKVVLRLNEQIAGDQLPGTSLTSVDAFMADVIGRLISPKQFVGDYQTREQNKARQHASDYSITIIVGVGWVRVHRKHGVLL